MLFLLVPGLFKAHAQIPEWCYQCSGSSCSYGPCGTTGTPPTPTPELTTIPITTPTTTGVCNQLVQCTSVEAPPGCRYEGRNTCSCGTLVCDTVSPTLIPSVTGVVECPLKSQGDANCDGKINTDDFNIWRDEFLNPYTGEAAPPPLRADFNGVGNVTTDDFNIWRDGFLNAALPH